MTDPLDRRREDEQAVHYLLHDDGRGRWLD